MDIVIYLIAGPLFLISVVGHIYVKIYFRPKYDSDLDDYYYELEDQHPELARYNKWSRITFTGTAIGVLLLFLAVIF